VMTSYFPHSGLPDTKIPLVIRHSENPKSPCGDWRKYPGLREEIKDMIMKCWARSHKRPIMKTIETGLDKLLHETVGISRE
ncbi:hypothetical protein FS837_008835, partial [Tulasnella sp. UAMH 9824]